MFRTAARLGWNIQSSTPHKFYVFSDFNYMKDNLGSLILNFPETSSVNKVSDMLKGKKEIEIYDALAKYLDTTEGRMRIAVVTLLVKKINKKNILLAILDSGLSKKMANEIGYWLNLLLPKIGASAFVARLNQLTDEDAKKIAEYHITFFEPLIRDEVNKAMVDEGINKAMGKS